MRKKIYFENLDALRFLAFLSVFLFHSFYTSYENVKEHAIYNFFYEITRYGWLGVNFFFVLSGFLITYLIVKEEQEYGRIHLTGFYIRRILRIWPLYYLIVGFCFIVYPLLAQKFSDQVVDLPNIWFFLLHISNYNFIYSPSDIPTLNILWSISIEEQFYFIWPVLFFLVIKLHHRLILFAGILVGSLIFTWIYRHDFHYYHHHILACAADLTIGGVGAILIANYQSFKKLIEQLPTWIILIFYLVMMSYMLFITYKLLDNIRVVTSLFFLGVILEQSFAENSIFKIGNIKWFTLLGRYTYGLYCYHYLALLLSLKISQKLGTDQYVIGVVFFENVLGLIITIAVAFCSYHFFESPFLKLKRKFSYFEKGT